jgi:hypothetical protein
MNINLNECKELPSIEYNKLIDPKFKGQTRVDPETNKYWMVFESEDILYKFQHTL